MSKNRQVVLQNPFHPLDLSPHDLLAIFKRFQQSRQINRNLKQQLPIQIIAQMISTLKGCPPSYIQKCISQALIKQTISWNEFLTFLDQQSQVRQKILEWLMFQKSTVKYKHDKDWPFRNKINKLYEEVTFLKFIQINEKESLVICSVDKIQFFLFAENDDRLFLLDSYSNRSDNSQEKIGLKQNQDDSKDAIPLSSKIFKKQPKFKKGLVAQGSRSGQKTQKSDREKTLLSVNYSTSKMNDSAMTKEEEQLYYKRERKNINSLFNIFRDLNLENSVTYAKAISKGISDKNINFACIPQLKEAFPTTQQKTVQERRTNQNANTLKPLEKAKGLLRNLYKQKRILSYNPYSLPKNNELKQFQMPKKLQKQRKQRLFSHESSQEVYSSKLRCLAIMHFSMQLVLVKIVRQYNKIALQEQDKIKIITQNQHKKNQIIEAINFYFHSIVDCWFLIVLIRVELKNQFRNANQSYIRGYQIQLVDNKRRNDKDYRFKHRKQTFSLPIVHGANGAKFEIFSMQMQVQYGIHFISVNGRYICYREDFIESKEGGQSIYFVFNHEQRFRNANLALSCMSVGQDVNKIAFGTIRGILITYDMFSHHFKMKKVSNEQIAQLKLVGHLCYILTVDQKFIVLDEAKGEQLQHLNVKNQTKLHQKIKHFQMRKNEIYFYGTQVKSYSQYVDEKLLHQRRKMQTIYRWRLDKLFKEESSFNKEGNYRAKDINKLITAKSLQTKTKASIELVISTQSYFLALKEILELIVLDKKSLKIKFTLILGIPHDSKVMKMALSSNEKLLALLLFNQNIFIFNIHTQDQYQHIKPSPFLRYTSLVFLDAKNQFMLATGSENGKIMLAPYSSIPEKSSKVLNQHSQAVTTLMIVRRQYLVSCGEDLLIAIWLLPFNILKHQIKLPLEVGFVVQDVGICKQFAYVRSVEGNIIEINVHQGKIIHILKDYLSWSICAIDPCTNNILGISKDYHLQVLAKIKAKWAIKTQSILEGLKGQVKGMGIIQSEKAVLFLQSGQAAAWSYQNQKLGKLINLCNQ